MTGTDHAARTAELEAEEARLVFDRFDFAEAWAIGRTLVETAPAPVAIRIQVADRVLFAAALDGTSADNQVWLDLKSAAVRQFGRSSLWLHHRLKARGRTLADSPSIRTPMADHGGAFPIRIGAQVVGVIGVSGLPHEDDHRLITSAIEAWKTGRS
ncbi:heme-binding protein [Inquilinus limosus]|uniref:heme-degrading domain-containing protein n=1 Tax=Inquilinus limosus TaxID=171674 RepID=UPI003F1446FC